jgi:hypothetical protein
MKLKELLEKITPLEWSLGHENAGDGRNIYRFRDYIGHTCGYEPKPGSGQRTLSKEEAEANAAYIAHAANNFPAVVEALKAIANECERQGDNEYNYEIGRTARNSIRIAEEVEGI